MADEKKPPIKPEDKTKKEPDVKIEPLTDEAVKDVAGGFCSAEACSSGSHCVQEA